MAHSRIIHALFITMRRCTHRAALLVFLMGMSGVCVTLTADGTATPTLRPLTYSTPRHAYKDGEVIVRMKDPAMKKLYALSRTEIGATSASDDAVIHAVHDKMLATLTATTKIDDLHITHTIDDLNIAVVASDHTDTDTLRARLAAHDAVAYAEPNYVKTLFFTPNDPYFARGYQWYHSSQSTDHDIDTTEAWDSENAGATPTTVAFIDSGIMHDNADLNGNLWTATGCNPTTDPACPKHGWDFADNDHDPYDISTDPDFRGHGTMVASIFAARTNNAIGLAGMSRYGSGKIMSLRFDLSLAAELEALAFAKARGVRIINASFGGDVYVQSEYDAIAAFDGIVVTAAGNGGSDKIGDNVDATPQYPCNYDLPNIICVGASDRNDTRATFSNYGTSVDIAAPGVDVIGTIENDTYYTGSGTSYATALVSGAIAALWSHHPSASVATIRTTLLASSDHLSTLADAFSCGRRLNLNTALRAIQSGTIPTETCPSTIASPIYRFWSDAMHGHFYTASAAERDHVITAYPDNVWRYEGVAFTAFTQPLPDTTPVYRFWSNTKRHHFYTASQQERDHVIAQYDANTWRYEGIAYYAYPSALSHTAPVYRFWSDTQQGHFYTASAAERDHVITAYPDNVWRYEGIGWYIPQ